MGLVGFMQIMGSLLFPPSLPPPPNSPQIRSNKLTPQGHLALSLCFTTLGLWVLTIRNAEENIPLTAKQIHAHVSGDTAAAGTGV